jgi:hypothetical protein
LEIQAVSLCLHLLPQAHNEPPPGALTSQVCLNRHPGDLNGRGTMRLHRQKANDTPIGDSHPSLAGPHRLSTHLSSTFVPKTGAEESE